MNQRRMIAAGFFSAVIVVVLAIIVYIEALNSSRTVSVLILRHNVTAGTAYTDDTVSAVTIKAAEGDFSYETRTPEDVKARFKSSMQSGDILRPDDLVSDDTESEVALTVAKSPQLNSGDNIDIYAQTNGTDLLLIGANMKVLSATPLTVLVPTADEARWAVISGSGTSLVAVRSPGGTTPPRRRITLDQVLGELGGGTTGESTGQSTATPTPGP